MEDLTQFSGEEHYRVERLRLPILKLNGEVGRFVRLEKDGGTGEYVKTEIGQEVKGVILRVRRSMGDFDTGFGTTEHNHKKDVVKLYQHGQKIDEGVAEELRTKYPELRVNQIVYFLLDGKEVVKFMLHGSQLMSDNTEKGKYKFYEYVNQFAKGEHVYEYYTVVGVVKEQNKKSKKFYYSTSFTRGAKLNEEEYDRMSVEIKSLAEYFGTNKSSKSFEEKMDKEVALAQAEGPTIDSVAREGDIKPEDIPF